MSVKHVLQFYKWCCQSGVHSHVQVCYLHGIEKLLQLLDIDHEGVQHAAAGALRNVVYQSSQNKMEVKEKGGLATILLALRSTRDVPTRRELTGKIFKSSYSTFDIWPLPTLTLFSSYGHIQRPVCLRCWVKHISISLLGLLWNLSSHDLLKERLAKESLSVLTKSVLVPSSGISDGENPKDELLADATVFYNAIGCLK